MVRLSSETIAIVAHIKGEIGLVANWKLLGGKLQLYER